MDNGTASVPEKVIVDGSNEWVNVYEDDGVKIEAGIRGDRVQLIVSTQKIFPEHPNYYARSCGVGFAIERGSNDQT